MKFSLRLFLAGLLALAPLARLHAQTPASSPGPVAPNPAEAEMRQLFERMAAKMRAGHGTERDLAVEIGDMDALIAKYRTAQPEQAAMISLMKAGLYLQVFDNPPKSAALLRQIKTDYPRSEAAGGVDELLKGVEARMAADARFPLGQPFPTFSEKDLDGQPLDLASYRGKVVLIDFWATWCGPCVRELPNVLAAYAKYHGRGFEIIGVSLDKDRETLVAFLKENNMTWKQYFDGEGWHNKVSTSYGIDSIPATFLLDGSGRIVARNLRGAALDEKLATLLAR